MKNGSLKNMFKSYDDIFNNSVNEISDEVVEIELDKLKGFEKHPFKIEDDDRFKELVDSIANQGVIVPGLARPLNDGTYEIISGHTRKKACEKLGLKTMPMIIKKVNDDEATVIMVDSNIQREIISICEKARAYRMKYDAIRHQGVMGGNSLEMISEKSGDNIRTIQRFIRLSFLIDELMGMLDEKTLSIRAGVELSYISIEEQKIVYDILSEYNYYLSEDEAKELRTLSKSIGLKKMVVFKTLGLITDKESINENVESEHKMLIKHKNKPFKIDRNKFNKYFPEEETDENIEIIIFELLEEWFESREKGGVTHE